MAEALSSDIRIIPIILEHCDWQNHQLSDFQALPDKGKPISKWDDESDGWQNVVEGIREAVEEMQSQTDSSSGTSEKELRAELAFQHGNVFMMIGQINGAIEHYSRAIELNPNNANTYHNRGVAYCSKGNYDRAIEDFGKVIELKPNDADGYNSRGEVYSNEREYDGAIRDFTKALALNPNHAHTYYNRGTIYCNKGNYDRAIADFDIAIELNPNDAYAYSNRGTAYTNKGELAKAIVNYTRAIELNPNYGITYNNRGRVWLYLREWERAKSDLTVAKDLGMDIVAAFHNDHESVEVYERRNRIKVPEDIATMLTQRRRSRYPKTEKFLGADGTPLESSDVLNLLAEASQRRQTPVAICPSASDFWNQDQHTRWNLYRR